MYKLFFFMKVDDENNYVGIEFIFIILYCSMVILIGLFIRVKFFRFFLLRFKVRELLKVRFKILTN